MQMAYELYKWLGAGRPAFQVGDNSPEDRIRLIANAIKHTAEKLDRESSVATHTLPIWLSNQGLQSYDASVNYAELTSVLSDLAKFADTFQSAARVQQLRRDALSQDVSRDD